MTEKRSYGETHPPLEDREIEWERPDGEKELIPAIDERWCDSMAFPKFYCFNYGDLCPVKTWLSMMDKMNGAIEFLLELDYHKFWSQIVFDSSNVHAALNEFLRGCPRSTEPEDLEKFFGDAFVDLGVPQAMTQLYSNVLRVLIRMSTPKELNENYMSEEYFGQILYDRSIFTIPRFMDLLCVYGESNEKMVNKMMISILSRQPKYFNDLRGHVRMMVKIMLPRCEKEANAIAGEAIVGIKGVNRRGKLEIKGTNQLILYSCDMLNSMDMLSKFIQMASMILYEEGLCTSFPKFYDVIYKCMHRSLDQRADNKFAVAPLNEMRGRLEWFENRMVEFVRNLIDLNVLKPLLGYKFPNNSKLEDDKRDEKVEEFFKILSQIVEESEMFAAVYNDAFPLQQDFDALRSKGVEIDSVLTEHLNQRFLLAAKHVAQEAKSALSNGGYLEGAPKIPVLEKEQGSLTSLKDMLPDYDEVFLWCCLVQFVWKQDGALNAILSKNLPRWLNKWRLVFASKGAQESDAPMGLTPDKGKAPGGPHLGGTFQEVADGLLGIASGGEKNGVSSKRKTDATVPLEAAGPSWENDFDREPILRPLTKGKKHDSHFSDRDRSEVKAMGKFYGQRSDETRNSDEEERYNEYEDEYDDTYDSNTQGAMDEMVKRLEGMKPTLKAEGQAEFERYEDAMRNQSGDRSEPTRRKHSWEREREPAAAGAQYRGRGGHAQGSGRGDHYPREFTRGGFYTGGRDRMFKERRGRAGHNQKNRAKAKYSRGMF